MTVLSGFTLVTEVAAGPASYATATPPTIEIGDLRQVDAVISIFIDDGHSCQFVSLVGQTVTFRVRGDSVPIQSTAGEAHDEVTDGVDLSGSNITVLAYGR